jgi:hypothetical protein
MGLGRWRGGWAGGPGAEAEAGVPGSRRVSWYVTERTMDYWYDEIAQGIAAGQRGEPVRVITGGLR